MDIIGRQQITLGLGFGAVSCSEIGVKEVSPRPLRTPRADICLDIWSVYSLSFARPDMTIGPRKQHVDPGVFGPKHESSWTHSSRHDQSGT